MAEGAALLVDHVLPAVGYRQWVLSFPGPMAVRLGYDAPLLAAIAGRLARAVMQDTPTPSPASSTAPAPRLRLLLPANSCCSPDRAPLRRPVHPLAPRCRPRCPSRAPGRMLRHARASSRPQDRAKIPRPRAPPQLTGPLRTHPRPRIPALNRLSADDPFL